MNDVPVASERGEAHPRLDSPAAAPGAPGHHEWLIDEAVQETFPASDPTIPSRPGSTVALHYARVRDRNSSRRNWLFGAAVVLAVYVAARVLNR